ncbi:C-type lectin domain family 2 member L-like isoform X1 [Ornithorhynchus anatinus]|uniref:C-type lectin domain family 2 member L-like isoform X1 n=1 Tax=Ornithorhynchus anatinus TaxID=9258 RepID=UPI0010A9341F|nr:C-type lectin domain family 2 member L-like isoform X1 [Ornithorhynchus anatinus]
MQQPSESRGEKGWGKGIAGLRARCPTCPSEPCPSDAWQYHHRKCYFLSEDQGEWTEGQQSCSSQGASLAVIEDERELATLRKLMFKKECWIGLRKNERYFFWVNGTKLDSKRFQVSDHADCAYITPSTVSTSSCEMRRNWICSCRPFHSSKPIL